MYDAMARCFHSQPVKHWSRTWIPLNWKYLQPGIFEKSVDWKQRQPCFCVCRFGNGWKYPKDIDAVCERASADMGEYWMSFMDKSNILLQNVDTYHVGILDEYLSSTRAKLTWMLACNSYDYG